MTDKLLELQGLHAFYGDSHVVQGVDLAVGSECLAVLGRNGMGKTTLLRAILGLNPPRRVGRVVVAGQDVSNRETYEIAARGIGYVPQGRRLFSSLTVDEHLRLAYNPRKNGTSRWTPRTVYDMFPEIARRKRVSGTKLSGGEQQMLALGRALLTNPRLLLLDEPSEGLAPVAIMRVVEICRSLRDDGMAMILVEQNLKVAEALASRACVMVTGKVVHECPMEELAGDAEAKHRLLGV